MNLVPTRKKIQAADCNVPIILVVEDNFDNLLFISHLLIFLKYNFITASNGRDALDLATKYEIDLVLLDLILPDIDGIKLVERFKEHQNTQNMAIIAITALIKERIHDRAMKVGCDDYLEKPYFIDDLKVKIQQYLPNSFLQQTLSSIINLPWMTSYC